MSAMTVNFSGPSGSAREIADAVKRCQESCRTRDAIAKEEADRHRRLLNLAYAQLALNGHEREETPCEPT